MTAATVFALTTAGATTVAALLTGAATQALAGAATASATATGVLNQFAIDGGGLIPPYVLMGGAVSGATASADLSPTGTLTGPHESRDFTARISPAGALLAA